MTVFTDAISERTAAAGVTVDGLLIKDGALPGLPGAGIDADQAAALAAYEAALAAATAGQLLTASGPGVAGFEDGAPSLSDYSNVIVVDAGGRGDFTTLSAAITSFGASVPDGTRFIVVSSTTEPASYLTPVTAGKIFISILAGVTVNLGTRALRLANSGIIEISGPGTLKNNSASYGTITDVSGTSTIILKDSVTIENTGGHAFYFGQNGAVNTITIDFENCTLRGTTSGFYVEESLPVTVRTVMWNVRFYGTNSIYSEAETWTNAPIYHSFLKNAAYQTTFSAGTAAGTNVVPS